MIKFRPALVLALQLSRYPNIKDGDPMANSTVQAETTNTLSSSASRSLTRQGTGSKIFDYFEKKASQEAPALSVSITRQNSADVSDATTVVASSPGVTVAPSSPSQGDATPASATTPTLPEAPKMFKITAGNGRKVAERLQLPSKKKTKRDTSFDTDDEMDGGGSLRRHNSRARLGLLLSLPLDVLFEVFGHLQPLDILHLARTTKALRALLLHRSSTSVWKDALSNVTNVPACPEDMTLPSWVNLLFDTHCHNCLTPNVSKCVDFLLRVRYCSKCVKIELSSEKEYNKEVKRDSIIRHGVPFSDWSNSGVKHCSIRARDAFLKVLDAHKGDRTAFLEQQKAQIKVKKIEAKICRKWYEEMVDERETELEVIRIQRTADIRDKLEGMGYQDELVFLDQLNAGKCAVIPWPKITMFPEHHHIKQTKPLTKKVWANIERKMVRYMMSARKVLDENERFLLYRRRRTTIYNAYIEWRRRPESLKSHKGQKFMPGPADILECDLVENLVKGRRQDDIIDEKVLADLFLGGLAEVSKRWNCKIIDDLWSLIQNPSLRPPLPSDRYHDSYDLSWRQRRQRSLLQLAAVVFRCKSSLHFWYTRKWFEDEGIPNPNLIGSPDLLDHDRQSCMWYPEYLFHPCCTTGDWPREEVRAEENLFLGIEKEYVCCRRLAWKVDKRLEFDEKASRMVRNLLEAARLDWTETTVDEMDTLDWRFVCLKCTFGNKCDGARRVRVWSWRDAVQHCFRSHFGDAAGVKWECISASDTIQARELEVAEGVRRGYLKPAQQKLWKCIYCRDTVEETGRMSWTQLRTHFLNMPTHGDANAMEGKEEILYYKALDYGPRERPPVKMIPAPTEAT